jgi:hypothetical protein
MSATGTRYALVFIALLLLAPAACKTEKPVEPKKPQPTVIIKPKPPLLTAEQRAELHFPEDLIAKVELSAGAEAEPFFTTVLVPSENLKGEQGIEKEKLAGFSVRTKDSDELIRSYRAGLRVKGYLIFKSHKGYGSLPDIVTVVKGNNSYDLLKMQGTEAANYRLDTQAIIAWLREQQQSASFVVIGAGPDWVEARFVKQPENMLAFARKVLAFAPDVREYGVRTADRLADRMKKNNGFYLVWD